MQAARTPDRPEGDTHSMTGTLRSGADWIQRQRSMSPVPPPGDVPAGPLPNLKVLVTAEEAYREFERLVLGARETITAGFRIFDPTTRLLSDEALAVGDTWEDLIADALKRGVKLRLVLSDFDPLAAPPLHRKSWRTKRLLTDRAEADGTEDRLDVDVHMHPAQSGYPIRLAAAPSARKTLRKMAKWINSQGDTRRRDYLRDAPGLCAMFDQHDDGSVSLADGVVPPLRPVTHHQKLAVIDREALYIGGLDLDDRRSDGKAHDRAGSRTWADVQLSLTGPIAAEAEDHLLAFRDEVSGKRRIAKKRPGLLRTLSQQRTGLGALGLGPAPAIHEVSDTTLRGVADATRFVYLETQFLRDLHFARDLARRARQMPDLGLIVCLPAAPEELAFEGARGIDMRFGEHLQNRCVGIIGRAFGDRAAFVSPAQTRGRAPDGTRGVLHGAPIIYVHSKVSIFDDALGIVSSANLNGRSARWDTEAGIALTDPEQVAHLRDRVMRHWLPETPSADLLGPDTAPIAWRELAETNRDTAPADRRGFLLPYPASAPRKFGRPLPGMTQDMM